MQIAIREANALKAMIVSMESAQAELLRVIPMISSQLQASELIRELETHANSQLIATRVINA